MACLGESARHNADSPALDRYSVCACYPRASFDFPAALGAIPVKRVRDQRENSSTLEPV